MTAYRPSPELLMERLLRFASNPVHAWGKPQHYEAGGDGSATMEWRTHEWVLRTTGRFTYRTFWWYPATGGYGPDDYCRLDVSRSEATEQVSMAVLWAAAVDSYYQLSYYPTQLLKPSTERTVSLKSGCGSVREPADDLRPVFEYDEDILRQLFAMLPREMAVGYQLL